MACRDNTRKEKSRSLRVKSCQTRPTLWFEFLIELLQHQVSVMLHVDNVGLDQLDEYFKLLDAQGVLLRVEAVAQGQHRDDCVEHPFDASSTYSASSCHDRLYRLKKAGEYSTNVPYGESSWLGRFWCQNKIM